VTRARVLLADDHLLLLEALAALLAPAYDVVAQVTDGLAMVTQTLALRPDVVVADLSMPVLDGLEATRQIRDRLPSARVVILTMHAEPSLARAAFEAGAGGFVLKSAAVGELQDALSEVLAGRRYVSPTLDMTEVTDPELAGEAGGSLENLTPRELEVLRLLAQGLTMKQVGAALGITPRTVAYHKYRMMNLLGACSTAELVQFAVRQGIV
jgi:DNA-binding NarL/FixJ family response regulator